jgi:hypothetical protein
MGTSSSLDRPTMRCSRGKLHALRSDLKVHWNRRGIGPACRQTVTTFSTSLNDVTCKKCLRIVLAIIETSSAPR